MKQFLILLISILLSFSVCGQVIDGNQFGINIRYGNSSGKGIASPNLQEFPSYFSAGYGLEYLISMKKNADRRPLIPYLRTELNFNTRSGIFLAELPNTGYFYRTRSVDLSALIPLTGRINDGTYFYISVGPNVSWTVSSQSTSPSQDLMPAIKFGGISEFGLSFKGERLTSLLGLRLLSEATTYGFNEYSVFYSITGGKRKK